MILDLTKNNNNIIKMNTTMKKIYSRITFVVILLLLGGVSVTWAQGFFGAHPNDLKTRTEDIIPYDNSGFFRDDFDWGGGGSDRDSDPFGDDVVDPIGEGIFILSLLSGVYALIKRKVKIKHEN